LSTIQRFFRQERISSKRADFHHFFAVGGGVILGRFWPQSADSADFLPFDQGRRRPAGKLQNGKSLLPILLPALSQINIENQRLTRGVTKLQK